MLRVCLVEFENSAVGTSRNSVSNAFDKRHYLFRRCEVVVFPIMEFKQKIVIVLCSTLTHDGLKERLNQEQLAHAGPIFRATPLAMPVPPGIDPAAVFRIDSGHTPDTV